MSLLPTVARRWSGPEIWPVCTVGVMTCYNFTLAGSAVDLCISYRMTPLSDPFNCCLRIAYGVADNRRYNISHHQFAVNRQTVKTFNQ